MTNKTLFWYSLVFLLTLGCTKKEILQIDFKGDLELKVFTYSELGTLINDKADIEITIEGSNPEIKVLTDTSGSCTIKDLPIGTYNLIFAKNGYGISKIQGLKFFGGDTPYNRSISIVRKSTTRIISYDLSISGNNLLLSGIITHQYPVTGYISYPYYWPGLLVYLSDSPTVSSTNFLSSYNFYSDKDIDTKFSTSMNLNASLFPTGRTIYVIIYGRGRMSTLVYDYEKDISYDTSTGVPSEIKSIVVP